MEDYVAHLLQSQKSTRRLLGGFQFLLADYEENETHLLGMVNTCVLAACFTQSRWIKPSPMPPVHQCCPEHQSQAYGEGKVLFNRTGKIKIASPSFLCLLLLLLLPSQLMRCRLPALRQLRTVSSRNTGPCGRLGTTGQRWTGVGKCILEEKNGRKEEEKKWKGRITLLNTLELFSTLQ